MYVCICQFVYLYATCKRPCSHSVTSRTRLLDKTICLLLILLSMDIYNITHIPLHTYLYRFLLLKVDHFNSQLLLSPSQMLPLVLLLPFLHSKIVANNAVDYLNYFLRIFFLLQLQIVSGKLLGIVCSNILHSKLVTHTHTIDV